MHLDQFLYFSEVYRLKSINAASFNLNISQQSLSKSISKMEKECNCTFFLRTPKGLIPTADGERFYITAQNIITEYAKFFTDQHLQKDITFFDFYHHSAFTDICENLYKKLVPLYEDYFFNFQPFGNPATVPAPNPRNLTMFLSLSDKIDALNIFPDYKIKTVISQPITVAFWCHKNSPFSKEKALSPNDIKNNSYIISNIPAWETVCAKKFFPGDFFINYQYERLYQFSTSNIAYTMVQKNHRNIIFELCLNGKPLIEPTFYNYSDLLLIPGANFPTFTLFLVYQKSYELLSQIVANHLADLLTP